MCQALLIVGDADANAPTSTKSIISPIKQQNRVYTLIKGKSQSIEISSLLIYSSSTFYCEILDAEENVICVLNKTVYS